MSQLIEIVEHNRRKKQKINVNLPPSFPPLADISEITLVDHNGKPYVFRLMKNASEPALDAPGDTIAYESLSIDLNDIKEIFVILTDEQRDIVMHIYYLYKNKNYCQQNDYGQISEDNPRIILQGPAGTGKSTVINFVEKLITWEENKTSDSPQHLKVIKCAFTGKAASNIDGNTLSHTFSIPYKSTRFSQKRLAIKRELLKNCIFFICDEISMVGEKTMKTVNLRLQQIFENEKLYGDRFVLLVGDLHQIDPVKQHPVYPDSEYWTCCEFYELTKIIRQHDERFINALNNFRDSQMTQDDIDLLRSREVQDIDQVPDSVVHLFYLNRHVDEHNTYLLNKSNEKEETVNTIEDKDNWQPCYLRVKIGIRYMITDNIDVGDGLANGTTGVVKGFDYDEDGCVSVIWMEFHSNAIGKKARSDYLNKHNTLGFENCVPIQRSRVVVKLKSDPNVSKSFGNMFPLKAAEAITVHKSQGQTYHEGVCVHLTSDPYDKLRTNKCLQYVALTRVKQIEDLYISGSFNYSVMNNDKFTLKENELNRLRTEKKLKLAFETFECKKGDVIVYLNTELTFNEHYQFITTDKWYKNASLLIFTETNTIASDKIEIPNFEIAFRSDEETALRSGGGIICYKEKSKTLEVISSICNVSHDENKIYLTLLLFEKFLYIITGVKGDLSDDYFKRAINRFISTYVREARCIFLIGDVIINPNTTPSLTDFLNENNFKKELSCEILTTNGETQSDLVYTRNFEIQQDRIGFYQYIPSSHKPIYVELPPKSELLNTHGVVDCERPGTSQQNVLQEAMEMD